VLWGAPQPIRLTRRAPLGVFVPVTGFLGNAPARQPTHRLGSTGAGGLYLRPWGTPNVWLTRCAQWGYTVKCSVEDA